MSFSAPTGHAFVQNLRRGFYELALDALAGAPAADRRSPSSAGSDPGAVRTQGLVRHRQRNSPSRPLSRSWAEGSRIGIGERPRELLTHR